MTNKIRNLVYIGLAVILSFQAVSAQSDRDAAAASAADKYLISAKAGGVNYVEGSVSVVRTDGRSGYLTKRDQIEVGDTVTTGDNSRAEILLNPGSFLRLGPNSSFKFKTTSLDDLRINLESGSAIFEVFASRDFKVRVITPDAKLLLIRSGVFRIDVLPGDGANVEVWEGQALLGDRNATLLDSGRSAILKDGTATVKKFDRGDRDQFEAWSKSRSKELAKQSAKLKNDALRNSLLTSFNGGGWGMYSSFGLWVYDPFYGGYCFLPFGRGWSSPYGYGFGSCLCYFDMPPYIYYPPTTGGGGGVGGGGGGSNVPPVTPIVSAGNRLPTPPFERMGGSGGGFGATGRGTSDSQFPSSGGRTPRSEPASEPTPIFIPAPMPMPSSTDKTPSTAKGKP